MSMYGDEVEELRNFLNGDLSSKNMVDIPSENLLDMISYEVSLGKSVNKLAVTPDIVKVVESDARAYETIISNISWLKRYCCRVKTLDSIQRKVERMDGFRFQSVFNDILGIRIKVDDYLGSYPSYFRVVDMRNGKSNDDGYRAVHLYYKKDNYHYPIEIQLWSRKDYEFNSWTHAHAYKSLSSATLLELRKQYDSGLIPNETEFIRVVTEYVNGRG